MTLFKVHLQRTSKSILKLFCLKNNMESKIITLEWKVFFDTVSQPPKLWRHQTCYSDIRHQDFIVNKQLTLKLFVCDCPRDSHIHLSLSLSKLKLGLTSV